jgi:hypothetical protein
MRTLSVVAVIAVALLMCCFLVSPTRYAGCRNKCQRQYFNGDLRYHQCNYDCSRARERIQVARDIVDVGPSKTPYQKCIDRCYSTYKRAGDRKLCLVFCNY